MTSAYDESMPEREEKATTPRGATKPGSIADQELHNNPETAADMEENSSSRMSLATGDSADEEILVVSSSAEISILPGESFDEDSTSVHDEETPGTTEGREKDDDKNNHEADLNYSASSLNETSDTPRMDRSRNKGSSSLEENERHGERRESVSTLSASIAPEIAVTCSARKSQAKDQRSQSMPETRMQERCTWDDVPVEKNPRDSHVAGTRARCEIAEELRPDEAQDEIVQGGQSDSYDFYDAVRSGNVKRVSALIASGCVQNLDEPDWNVSGDSPLLVAATNQCLPVLR